jgi:hypothetical protein
MAMAAKATALHWLAPPEVNAVLNRALIPKTFPMRWWWV